MRLTLLGTGTPKPNPHRRGPASLIRAGSDAILVDCGSGVVHRLVEAGVSPGDVHTLLLTHLHSDHFIDLAHFVVMRWISGDDRPLNVAGPRGTRNLVAGTLALLEPDIRMRMKIRREPRELPRAKVNEIDAGPVPLEDGPAISAFDVQHYPLEQPFGYRFAIRDRVIVLSGDTCPSENLIRHAKGADVLVHECMVDQEWHDPRIDHDLTERSHTSPEKLGPLAREAGVGLLITTHMNPDTRPSAVRETVARDFLGPMVVGEDLMTV
jgi:ribonuclease Z